jgi:hypothetical protein
MRIERDDLDQFYTTQDIWRLYRCDHNKIAALIKRKNFPKQSEKVVTEVKYKCCRRFHSSRPNKRYWIKEEVDNYFKSNPDLAGVREYNYGEQIKV